MFSHCQASINASCMGKRGLWCQKANAPEQKNDVSSRKNLTMDIDLVRNPPWSNYDCQDQMRKAKPAEISLEIC